MKRKSVSVNRHGKNRPGENLYQSSRTRYLRAFARARAMKFWRPRIWGKHLTVTATFAAALAIAPTAAHAQFPASFDLSTIDGTNGFVIQGIDPGDDSGTSVSGVGDFNGDGFDDVIIGAPYANFNNSSYLGASYVVFGGNSGPTSPLGVGALNGSNGFSINGVISDGFGGNSVSGAGDVNGDGFDDLIVGAVGADTNGNFATGQSYVVFGNNSGASSSFDLNTLNGTNGFAINGINSFDGSGRSVSGAGDFNGDGFDDLIIGASRADPSGNTSAGQSYVVFGNNSGFSPSLDLNTLNGTNGFAINGNNSGDQSGGSVSSAGDVNGDGFDDLIIGARFADPNGNSAAGQSYVVFGNSSGSSPSLNLSTLNGTNGFVINGSGALDLSGNSVSGAGDINGDGIDDVIIGNYPSSSVSDSYVVFGQITGFSSSLDLSTLNGANGFTLTGIPGSFTGVSVSGAGDVNGDGFDDLIIGASEAIDTITSLAGASYVVFGTNNGFSSSLDLSTLDGTNGFVLNGVNFDDRSGNSVSAAGDVNGDGIDDLIIGAYLGNRVLDQLSNASTGESYVVFGQAAVPSPLIGDVNQDGEVNFLDIAPFISILSSDGFLEEADINEDGVVDFLDIGPFIDVLSS